MSHEDTLLMIEAIRGISSAVVFLAGILAFWSAVRFIWEIYRGG